MSNSISIRYMKNLNLLQEHLKNKNLLSHSKAVAISMQHLANHFNEDKETWQTCGLLHDIDYEQTKDTPEQHSKIGSDLLREKGFSDEICSAVLTHNHMHNIEPESIMAKALYCVDPLTGLIVAATLVLPSKKIRDLKVKSILKKFKDKSFAKGANRDTIIKCKDYLNLELEEFIEITLMAMQEISDDLGL